jgi:hypothetical protein
MRIDASLKDHVESAFASLNRRAATRAFPGPNSLSLALNEANLAAATNVANVSEETAAMFATAAVDIWMRGVHSFLVSASLTGVSPVWSSVAGYYSSHYSVRAIAHLMGFFQLFGAKRVVHLQVVNGRYRCTFAAKNANHREHKLYWQIVKQDRHFAADPFFTEYNPSIDTSDVAHRDRANYADHLSGFPMFRPLDAEALRNRVERISEIEFTTAPIPRVSQYPDLESVQIVAYHRLVRFRDLVDTIVDDTNRFWSIYRNPAWAREFMDFQLTENATLSSQFTT